MTNLSILNSYAPLVTYSGNVINDIYVMNLNNLPVSQSFGTITIKKGETSSSFGEKGVEVDAEFGAALVVTGSGAVTVNGYDYLGQPMSESITAGSSGTAGKKAFKYISSVEVSQATSENTSFTVERKLVLGVPYRTAKILYETRNGVTATTTTLTAPVNTTQTVSTGDPRGTINLTTYASAANIKLVCLASAEIFKIDGEKVGGLFGIPHFAE